MTLGGKTDPVDWPVRPNLILGWARFKKYRFNRISGVGSPITIKARQTQKNYTKIDVGDLVGPQLFSIRWNFGLVQPVPIFWKNPNGRPEFAGVVLTHFSRAYILCSGGLLFIATSWVVHSSRCISIYLL